MSGGKDEKLQYCPASFPHAACVAVSIVPQVSHTRLASQSAKKRSAIRINGQQAKVGSSETPLLMETQKPMADSHLLICCYLLLNFLIGIKSGSAADSEGPLPDEVPVEGPPLYKTIEGAKTYIAQHQNKDGGWPLIPGDNSNVENTAFAIWALLDAGWGHRLTSHSIRGSVPQKYAVG